jgi:transposase
VKVAAPALIPREPSKTNKTDRLDAEKLARFLGVGVINRFVTIPEEKEEDERRLVRTLAQFKADKSAAKCRIKSFLLSEGARYGKSWSKNARKNMLDSVKGEQAKYSLGKLFEALEFAEKLVGDTKKRIRETVKHDEELSKRVEILDSHPGVGPQTAAAFALEMFPGRKFKNGNHVGSFLGLAPQVRSSGATEIRGSIIKKGRPELRRLLVQCAWRWVRAEKAGKKKFASLCKRTGSARKAIVAMARRLGIHLWKMLETGTFYNAKLYANAIKAN